jgi:hypothetical protein
MSKQASRYPLHDGGKEIGFMQFLAACRDCIPWSPRVFDDPESRDAWVRKHRKRAGHHVEMGLRTRLHEPPSPPAHTEPMMRHAWRWYWVEDGLLISPIKLVPLPGDGVLHDVHVFPSVKLMNRALQGRWMQHTPEDITARGYALTVGRAYPPFQHDGNIDATFGSTMVHRYEAREIFTDQAVRSETYTMTVVPRLDLTTLEHAEER